MKNTTSLRVHFRQLELLAESEKRKRGYLIMNTNKDWCMISRHRSNTSLTHYLFLSALRPNNIKTANCHGKEWKKQESNPGLLGHELVAQTSVTFLSELCTLSRPDARCGSVLCKHYASW